MLKLIFLMKYRNNNLMMSLETHDRSDNRNYDNKQVIN